MIGTASIDGTRGEVKGLQHIVGSITLPGHGLLHAELSGPDLELVLQDGRRWLCLLQSTDGTLVNRGGFS
jgi:hypothetical protein